MPDTAPRACVIGHPIAHSRSPLIHGHWLARHGLAGSYTRQDVPPAEFEAFVRAMPANGFVGGNVTIPHKEAAAALCDRLMPNAAALRAVNTIWFEDGAIVGDNTDVTGFIANLDDRAPGWRQARDGRPGTALVLGAGGAARGIVYGLIEAGAPRVLIANRTRERAEGLASLFPGRAVALGLDEAAEALPQADLLVNTTSLGMKGQPPLDLRLDLLPGHAIVADIVYVPLETPILAAARARGLGVVDGLGMLLHQAVPGFARWFGVVPQVTPELRALVEADVLGQSPAPGR